MKSLDRLLKNIEDPQMEQVTKQLHAIEDFIIVLIQQKAKQEILNVVQNIKNEQKESEIPWPNELPYKISQMHLAFHGIQCPKPSIIPESLLMLRGKKS